MIRQFEKTRLPLARAKTGIAILPDAKAIEKLFSVARTPEAADYFRDQLAAQVRSVGLDDKYKEVMLQINKFVDIVHAQTPDNSNYWSGSEMDIVTKFQAFQQTLSEQAVEQLVRKIPEGEGIRFDFAINEESVLLQGSARADGEALDPEATAQLNTIYSDWLTSNEMICEDGVIYESTIDGDKKKDGLGQFILANPDQYRSAFMDKKSGFAAFFKGKTNLEISVTDVTLQVPSTEFASRQ